MQTATGPSHDLARKLTSSALRGAIRLFLAGMALNLTLVLVSLPSMGKTLSPLRPASAIFLVGLASALVFPFLYLLLGSRHGLRTGAMRAWEEHGEAILAGIFSHLLARVPASATDSAARTAMALGELQKMLQELPLPMGPFLSRFLTRSDGLTRLSAALSAVGETDNTDPLERASLLAREAFPLIPARSLHPGNRGIAVFSTANLLVTGGLLLGLPRLLG